MIVSRASGETAATRVKFKVNPAAEPHVVKWYDYSQQLLRTFHFPYDKNKVKSLYDRAIQEKSPDLQAAVTRFFKVGSTYSAKDIKQTLKGMGLENAKGTSLTKWFHTKRVNSNGVMSYRILGRVTDNL